MVRTLRIHETQKWLRSASPVKWIVLPAHAKTPMPHHSNTGVLLHQYLNVLFCGFCISILSSPKDCRFAAVKGFEPAVQQSVIDSREVPFYTHLRKNRHCAISISWFIRKDVWIQMLDIVQGKIIIYCCETHLIFLLVISIFCSWFCSHCCSIGKLFQLQMLDLGNNKLVTLPERYAELA